MSRIRSVPPMSIFAATQWVDNLTRLYDRVAITGPPGVGKTTLSFATKGYWCSDALRRDFLGWYRQTAEVVRLGQESPRWLFEGVTIARALANGLPADAAVLVHSDSPSRMTQKRAALAVAVSRWIEDAIKNVPPSCHIYELHLTAPPPRRKIKE